VDEKFGDNIQRLAEKALKLNQEIKKMKEQLDGCKKELREIAGSKIQKMNIPGIGAITIGKIRPETLAVNPKKLDDLTKEEETVLSDADVLVNEVDITFKGDSQISGVINFLESHFPSTEYGIKKSKKLVNSSIVNLDENGLEAFKDREIIGLRRRTTNIKISNEED